MSQPGDYPKPPPYVDDDTDFDNPDAALAVPVIALRDLADSWRALAEKKRSEGAWMSTTAAIMHCAEELDALTRRGGSSV